MNNKYTVGSLFCGIGGICLGFKQAGAEVIWANDNDIQACNTYKANSPGQLNLVEGDVASLIPRIKENPNQFKVDILTSGFPCQAFSIAGYQNGFKDTRGNHFFETLELIEELEPEAFLLENVKNLQNHNNKRTFKKIEEYILDAGYSFIPKVLNTKDYGNIPQTRERIYIVGFKGEAEFNNNKMAPKAVCSRAFSFPAKKPLKKSIHDCLINKKAEEEYYYDNFDIYKTLKKQIIKKDTLYQWRRVYVRENKSKLCPTLTANMGTGGHNVPLLKDNFGIRKLTPEECLLFQGFPKSFSFPREMANCHKYKQAGNSVGVPVIKSIAKKIIKALDKRKLSKATIKGVRLAS